MELRNCGMKCCGNCKYFKREVSIYEGVNSCGDDAYEFLEELHCVRPVEDDSDYISSAKMHPFNVCDCFEFREVK